MSAPQPAKRTRFTDELRALHQAAVAEEKRLLREDKRLRKKEARALCAFVDTLLVPRSEFVAVIEKHCKWAAEACRNEETFGLVFKDGEVQLRNLTFYGYAPICAKAAYNGDFEVDRTVRRRVTKALRDALEDDSIAVSRKSGDELKIVVSFA